MINNGFGYGGLTPEQREFVGTHYDAMSPGIRRYDPLRVSAYTQGGFGSMPNAQYLTPASYGAFRNLPHLTAYNAPNQDPSFIENVMIAGQFGNGTWANTAFRWLPYNTYTPAVNQALYTATAARRVGDSWSAVLANGGDLAVSLPAFVAGAKVGTAVGGPIGGIAGGIGAALLVPSVGAPAVDRIREARYIQQRTMSHIVSGPDVDPLTGRGFSTAAASGLDRFIRGEAARDRVLKEGDYRALFDLGLERGMFDFTNSAEQYKRKIKQLRQTVTTAMEVLGSTDFQDILKSFERLQNLGVSSTGFAGVLRAENMFSRMVGMSHADTVSTFGQPGALSFAQYGMSPIFGSLQSMGIAAVYKDMMRQGIIGVSENARRGGISAVAQTLTAASANSFSQNKILEAALPILSESSRGTVIDKDALERLYTAMLRGDPSASFNALTSKASAVMSRDTGMQVTLQNNKQALLSQIVELLGPERVNTLTRSMAMKVGQDIMQGKNATPFEQLQLGLINLGYAPQTAFEMAQLLQHDAVNRITNRQKRQEQANARLAKEGEILAQTSGLGTLSRWWNVWKVETGNAIADFGDRYWGPSLMWGENIAVENAPRTGGAYGSLANLRGGNSYRKFFTGEAADDYDYLLEHGSLNRRLETSTDEKRISLGPVAGKYRGEKNTIKTFGAYQMTNRGSMVDMVEYLRNHGENGRALLRYLYGTDFVGVKGAQLKNRISEITQDDGFDERYHDVATGAAQFGDVGKSLLEKAYAYGITANMRNQYAAMQRVGNSDMFAVYDALFENRAAAKLFMQVANHGGGASANEIAAVLRHASYNNEYLTPESVAAMSEEDFMTFIGDEIFLRIHDKDTYGKKGPVSAQTARARGKSQLKNFKRGLSLPDADRGRLDKENAGRAKAAALVFEKRNMAAIRELFGKKGAEFHRKHADATRLADLLSSNPGGLTSADMKTLEKALGRDALYEFLRNAGDFKTVGDLFDNEALVPRLLRSGFSGNMHEADALLNSDIGALLRRAILARAGIKNAAGGDVTADDISLVGSKYHADALHYGNAEMSGKKRKNVETALNRLYGFHDAKNISVMLEKHKKSLGGADAGAYAVALGAYMGKGASKLDAKNAATVKRAIQAAFGHALNEAELNEIYERIQSGEYQNLLDIQQAYGSKLDHTAYSDLHAVARKEHLDLLTSILGDERGRAVYNAVDGLEVLVGALDSPFTENLDALSVISAGFGHNTVISTATGNKYGLLDLVDPKKRNVVKQALKNKKDPLAQQTLKFVRSLGRGAHTADSIGLKALQTPPIITPPTASADKNPLEKTDALSFDATVNNLSKAISEFTDSVKQLTPYITDLKNQKTAGSGYRAGL